MPGTFVRPSGILRAKTPIQPKEKNEKKRLPEDVKPMVYLETTSGQESTPSIFSELSFRQGMTNKEYWKKATDQVAHKIDCQSMPRIPRVDYSVVLPPRLKARVKKIMSYDYSESDDLVYIKDEMPAKTGKEHIEKTSDEEANVGEKLVELRQREVEESFNESQFSLIERLEQEFRHVHLTIDEPLRYTAKHVDHNNWMSKFLCNPDRVIWKSKAFEKDNLVGKTLDEQAEQLMDMSAERFIEWLNTFGSGKVPITAENLKDLFSIKGDRTILESIKSDPKEVNAIAKTIAEKWNRPDIAIETQYENHIKYRVKQVPKKKMLSAFGRTIPVSERPWHKLSTDVPIESVYPKELLSREKIFNGIRHFRSVKALINFYLKHPKLERPQYLVKCGEFNVDIDASVDDDIPLYEKLGLKY